MQNSAARPIVGTFKFDHMTKIVMGLNRLPVRTPISYKICVLAHKAVNGVDPVYLWDLICLYLPGRSFRSSDSLQLARLETRTKAEDAAFSVAAANLWNGLPTIIRGIHDEDSFKVAIKAVPVLSVGVSDMRCSLSGEGLALFWV